MVTDLELIAQVRVGTDSKAAKATGSRKGLGKTRLVAAGGDQIGKSEHEEGPRRASSGGPLDEGKVVARNR